jgi:glycosyltransferase involved in cell wall biosynthesis
MLLWEWARTGASRFQRWRRHRQLGALDARARKTASTASLTFMHTPAAVVRYRDAARQGFAIRQPGHEPEDVVSEVAFAAKREEILGGAPLTIVAACRHKPLKGLDFLIRAAALLKHRHVPFRLKIYGGGEGTVDLAALTVRHGVEDRCEFPGALPPGAEIYAAIAAGHVFAMPHRTTDFGRAFYDAMAGGTPVVAFRTPASIDTVRDGLDGLISPLDDAEALASTFERLHTNRPLLAELADGARQRALRETRSEWYRLRAERIAELF